MQLLCLFILICFSTVLAQSVGWTDLRETEITVGNNNYDIFTNRYGNNIIVQETGALKYYKMDVEGNTLSSSNLETSAVVSPSITGNADLIFVIYGISNEIRTKYSTDGGSNWSTLSNPIPATVISVESIVSKNNLHITYQESNSVKHSYRSVSGVGSWTTPFTVSGTYTASNPRIGVWNAESANKVYITYNTAPNTLRWSYNFNWFSGGGQSASRSPAMDKNGNIYFPGPVQYSTRIFSVDYYGTLRWVYIFEQEDEVITVPLICDADGTVYCGSTFGYYYYAISSEGELLWKLPLNGYQVDNSGAIGSDGTLYIGTHLASLATG